MDSLVCETGAPALGWCGIQTIPLATHGADHAVFPQCVLEGLAGVLAAPIRVVYQSPCRFPAEARHRQRVRHDVRRHAGLQ